MTNSVEARDVERERWAKWDHRDAWTDGFFVGWMAGGFFAVVVYLLIVGP